MVWKLIEIPDSKIVILWSWISWLMMANKLKEERFKFIVLEKTSSPPNFGMGLQYFHKPVLNLPFNPITVDYFIYSDWKFLKEPTQEMEENYSLKVIWKIEKTSISKTNEMTEGYLPENGLGSLIKDLANNVKDHLYFNSEITKVNIKDKYVIVNNQKVKFDILINTIPLNIFKNLLEDDEIECLDSFPFETSPIFVKEFVLNENTSNYNAYYLPDVELTKTYRTSVFDNKIFIEGLDKEELKNITKDSKLVKDLISNLKDITKIKTLKVEEEKEVSWIWAKINVIKGQDQKCLTKMMRFLSNNDCFCIWRYSTWNRKELMHNTYEKIESLISIDIPKVIDRNPLKTMFEIQKEFSENFYNPKDLSNTEKAQKSKDLTVFIQEELIEALQCQNYKSHRKNINTLNRENILYELVDIQKYLIQYVQLYWFTEEQFFSAFKEKSEIVKQRFEQEKRMPKLENIIWVDIDGVLGDYAKTFINFVNKNYKTNYDWKDVKSLDFQTELWLDYETYRNIKHEYRQRGYEWWKLMVYDGASEFLKELRNKGYKIVILTSRPVKEYSKIYFETMQWLRDNDLVFDHVIFDEKKNERLWVEYGNKVVWFVEDNLKFAKDISKVYKNLKIFLLDRSYNKIDKLPSNVKRSEDYEDILTNL